MFGEGTTYEEADIVASMERFIKKNIKLNPDKLKYKMTELLCMGYVISDIGMGADPNKVSAVAKMTVPYTKAKVQWFIGMCIYLPAYAPNLSAVIKLGLHYRRQCKPK